MRFTRPTQKWYLLGLRSVMLGKPLGWMKLAALLLRWKRLR